eukprot:TRINITY_DN607_c0_g1_i2.p1 TRINITY_DN607_c0_g1~~TRINITY_DN607_c0_g1_i2.p1  ORF type:complete len:254 (+),score=41.03 TRINITY_DN607_c0_g1_i2:146-907(+)
MNETTETQKNVNQFRTEFHCIKDEITSQLALIQNISKDDLPSQFESLFLKWNTMSKTLNEAMPVLPLYEITQAQKLIKSLEDQLSISKNSLLPKQKFSFKSSNKKKTNPLDLSPSCQKQPVSQSTTTPKDEKIVLDPNAICNLKDEEIFIAIKETKDSLHIFNLEGCKVYCGVVTGSVLIENCKDCVLVFASQQVRIHTCINCDFYIFVKSNPIIEYCSTVRFAPYCLDYPLKLDHFKAKNLLSRVFLIINLF